MDKHSVLPDILGSLMSGAREMLKKRGETTLHLAVLGLVYTVAVLTGLRRPAHTFLHGLASIWVLSVGRTVPLHSPAHSFYRAQAEPMTSFKFTKNKEKHGIRLILSKLGRAKSHHFNYCLKLS